MKQDGQMAKFLLCRWEDTITELDDLETLLRNFSANLCSDPRDKVYGLLGILSNSEGLVPDYSKTVMEVFEDASAYLFMIFISKAGAKAPQRRLDIIDSAMRLGEKMDLIKPPLPQEQDSDRSELLSRCERIFQMQFERYSEVAEAQKDWPMQPLRQNVPVDRECSDYFS